MYKRQVVGGGGSAGAGNEPTGAGGAGGYLAGTGHGVTAQSYSITIGAGGSQPSTSAGDLGNDGGNSSFDDFIAIGGGAGGGRSNTESIRKGRNGASGGGSGTDVAGSSGATTGGSATKSYLPTPAVDEDFTSYASQSSADAVWANNGNTSVGQVNIGTDVLDATGNVSTVAGVVRDIGAVGSTFVLRFKIVITTATQYTSGAVSAKLNIGLFSTNEDGRSAEELIAVDVNAYDNKYRFKAGGSITADAGGTEGAGGYTTETRYVEIKRLTSGKCKLSIFTSDAYTTSVLEGSKTLTPTGTITSALRYLGVKSGNSGSGDGTVVLTIDDISFWNNTTYVAVGDNIDVSSLADKRYLQVLGCGIGSGNVALITRFNDDDDDNYNNRYSNNGGTGTNSGANDRIFTNGTGSSPQEFSVFHIANKSDREKLMISHNVNNATTGAGNPPQRRSTVAKWVNTSSVISSVNVFNSDSGNYDNGSEVVVLGYDPDDTHTTNFWEELANIELTDASTEVSSGAFIPKKYLWVQIYCLGDGASDMNGRIQVGNSSGFDTTSKYAERQSTNGANPDGVSGGSGQDHFPAFNGGRFGNFSNMFVINNTSTEKLFIINDSATSTTEAITSTPNRREIVAKWENTNSQIDRIKVYRTTGSNYQAGSFIRVWGSD